MTARLDYPKAAPEVYRAMLGVEKALHSAFEPKFLHMIKLRASQINGCAFCIDMHWKDARAAGESEQRLYGLGAWRESPYYTDRERAALAWTEALTLIADAHSRGGDAASDADFALVRAQFSDAELANLSWAIAAINAWNRIAIGFRAVAGEYRAPVARGGQ